jgi:hypothetical protein
MDEDPGCYYVMAGVFLLSYAPIILNACGATWLSFALIVPVAVAAALAPAAWRSAGRRALPSGRDEPAYITELKRLASLRDNGVITKAEFEARKKQILALPVQAVAPTEMVPAVSPEGRGDEPAPGGSPGPGLGRGQEE